MEFGDLRSLVHEIKSSPHSKAFELTIKLVYGFAMSEIHEDYLKYASDVLADKIFNGVSIGDLLCWFNAKSVKTLYKRINHKHTCDYLNCSLFVGELALSILAKPSVSPAISIDNGNKRHLAQTWASDRDRDEDGLPMGINQNGWCVWVDNTDPMRATGVHRVKHWP